MQDVIREYRLPRARQCYSPGISQRDQNAFSVLNKANGVRAMM